MEADITVKITMTKTELLNFAYHLIDDLPTNAADHEIEKAVDDLINESI